MKRTVLLFAITIVMSVGQTSFAQRKRVSNVPPGFDYPEQGEKVVIKDILLTRALRGQILDPNGFPIEKALVETTGPNWSKRIFAVFSDTNGRFVLPKSKYALCYIKVTKYGFAPLLTRVRVTKRARSQIALKLSIAY